MTTNTVRTLNKYFLREVQTSEKSAWVVQLDIEGKTMPFKIDKGADISVITEKTWRHLLQPQLDKTSACLVTPAGQFESLREFMASTTWKGKPHTFKVVVVPGSLSNSLLARDVAVKMGPVARLEEVGMKKVGLMSTESLN